MRVEDVEIHVGQPGRGFRVLGTVDVRVAHGVFASRPTLDDANAKLRQKAIGMGANAIIDVAYRNRPPLFGGSMVILAKGLAVVLEPDERTCPFCAETIKSEAKVCRFCGHELSSPSKPTVVDIPPSHSVATGEPSAVAAAAPDEVLGTWIVREGPSLLLGDEVELRLRGGRLVVAAAGGAISTFDPKDVAVTAADDRFVRLLVSGQPLVALDWTSGIGGRALARRLGH